MIDTIKIALDVHPSVVGKDFCRNSAAVQHHHGGFTKVIINNKGDEYLPRLTLFRRGNARTLYVEFSAPKLLFGNNFEELADTDFEPLLIALQQKLATITNHTFTIDILRNAPVSICHFSKNIIFRDYTSCSTILDALSKQDISRTYDIQITKYRLGQSLQIHANSVDISFYDKIAELGQANKSPKRSIEPHALRQKALFEQLQLYKPFDVLRYEVRLVNRTKIKHLLPNLKVWNFESLFSSQISRKVLLQYWDELNKHTDFLGLDILEPSEILQNYLTDTPDSTINEALKATAGLLIIKQTSHRQLQQLITKKSGAHTWYRLKPLLKQPGKHRYKSFVAISKQLDQFERIRMPP